MNALTNKPLPNGIKQLLDNAPTLLAKPLAFLPDKISEPLFNFTLNKVFKPALEDEELEFLTNRWLKLTLTDVNFHCYITVKKTDDVHHLLVKRELPELKAQQDVEFSADVHSLALLARKQVDPDTLFFQRKLMVTGKTELGLAIKNFLDDFDFKESLPDPVKQLFNKLESQLK